MPSDRSEFETPTVLLLAATYAVWALGTLIWEQSAVFSVLLTGVAIAQFLSLQHEALHESETLIAGLIKPLRKPLTRRYYTII